MNQLMLELVNQMSPLLHAVQPLGASAVPVPTAVATAAPTAATTPITAGTSSFNLPTLVLSLVVFIPLVTAMALTLFPDRSRDDRSRIRTLGVVAAAVSMAIAAVAIFSQIPQGATAGGLGISPSTGSAPQACTAGAPFCEYRNWIQGFPLQSFYHLDADGITLVLIALSTTLFLAALFWLFKRETAVRRTVMLMLVLETGVNGVLCCQDYLLLMLFWSLTVAPLYLLIRDGSRSSGDEAARERASSQTLGYGLAATGALILSSLLLVVHIGPVLLAAGGAQPATFDFVANSHTPIETAVTNAAGVAAAQFAAAKIFEDAGYALMLAACLIMMGAFPVHRWLINAAADSDAAVGSVLLAVVPRLGAYIIIRCALTGFEDVSEQYLLVLTIAGVLTAVWGAIGAFAETDLRRLVGYFAMTQTGLVLVAIGAGTEISVMGAVLVMVTSGVAQVILVLLAGAIEERTKTRTIAALGGLAGNAPQLAMLWIVAVMSAIGVPLLAGFSADFTAILGAYGVHRWLTVVAVLALALGSVALLRSVPRVFFGPQREAFARVRDGSPLEYTAVSSPLILMLLWGLLPGEMMPILNAAIQAAIGALPHA